VGGAAADTLAGAGVLTTGGELAAGCPPAGAGDEAQPASEKTMISSPTNLNQSRMVILLDSLDSAYGGTRFLWANGPKRWFWNL
jgi:hypothetical protein